MKLKDNSTYAVSLLDTYSTKYAILPKSTLYIFGYLCHKKLSKNPYRNVSLKSFIKTLSKDINYEIVELLSESDRLSILDIFGQLNSFFSSQSIYRALSMLQKEKMVRIDKKTDKNIFYQLNDEYFIIAKNEINKKMKCYIRKKRKEENFYEEMD